jgi:Protein of unknown function (DUF3619)
MISVKKTIASSFGAAPRVEALEARLALRIAAHLNERAEQMPHDIAERLRVARLRALDHARALRKTSPAPAESGYNAQAGTLSLGGPPSWWLRVASLLPLVVLVGGLFLIQHRYMQQQIEAAAEIDAALLTDDLPPQAFSDPGFAEFLKAPRLQQ